MVWKRSLDLLKKQQSSQLAVKLGRTNSVCSKQRAYLLARLGVHPEFDFGELAFSQGLEEHVRPKHVASSSCRRHCVFDAMWWMGETL